jgi:hypothetical protein
MCLRFKGRSLNEHVQIDSGGKVYDYIIEDSGEYKQDNTEQNGKAILANEQRPS